MQEHRRGSRFNISFPIRVKRRDENGQEVAQDGLTENVGPARALVFLPRALPPVGGKVRLTVTENADGKVVVTAQVIRFEVNATHPQVAF